MEKLGELELNKIYCMDCLEGLKKLPDNSVDLILTDPPYNTKMKEKKNSAWLNSFFNDNLSDEEYKILMQTVIKEIMRVLKNNKPIFFFIDFRNLDKLKNWLELGGANSNKLLYGIK